jgi:hypothetical protein
MFQEVVIWVRMSPRGCLISFAAFQVEQTSPTLAQSCYATARISSCTWKTQLYSARNVLVFLSWQPERGPRIEKWMWFRIELKTTLEYEEYHENLKSHILEYLPWLACTLARVRRWFYNILLGSRLVGNLKGRAALFLHSFAFYTHSDSTSLQSLQQDERHFQDRWHFLFYFWILHPVVCIIRIVVYFIQ